MPGQNYEDLDPLFPDQETGSTLSRTLNAIFRVVVTLLVFATAALFAIIVFGFLGVSKAQAQSTSEAANVEVEQLQTPRLDQVRARGFVRCGTVNPQPGFAQQNSDGNWSGMDVDFCRALAVTLFADDTSFEFKALGGETRFVGLQTGAIDVLVRNGAWTLERDTTFGVNYVGALFYDGQAFMVRSELEKISALELDGQSICVLNNSEHVFNLQDFFFEIQTGYTPIVYETIADLTEAYRLGLCDVMSARQTDLAAARAQFEIPENHVILPEILSKEPMGPTVRAGDAQWQDLVFWVLKSLILAEELGLTSQSVLTMEQSPIFAVRQFLGLEAPFAGDEIGLQRDWAMKLVASVGNYGEIFERHFGNGSLLRMRRGQNALSGAGGIHIAHPLN